MHRRLPADHSQSPENMLHGKFGEPKMIPDDDWRRQEPFLYPSQKVFVLKVMTHEEYDEDRWKAECGCFAPAPGREKSVGRGPQRQQRGR